MPVAEPPAARAARLRYVNDQIPGIRRERAGQDFRFIGVDGRPIRDREELRRIRSLVIPPAWTDVWICPWPHGHLQATGRDAGGRKQYRYHPRWREVRDETKYDRMLAFAAALPRIRARVEQDLARPGMPREKVLATVVRLLETTLIRVGNDEYARQNHSYGLTTLHNRHVEVAGPTLRFHFRGKSGKRHAIDIRDRRLAAIVKRCRALPGHKLFEYLDEEGNPRTVHSGDVNDYLREVAGEEFTAKDFRTWAGTVLAALALHECETCSTEAEAKKNIVRAVETVAARLGNTPAVCRKCYVHPEVFAAYLDGALLLSLERQGGIEKVGGLAGLHGDEAAVMAFLQGRLARATGTDAPSLTTTKPRRSREGREGRDGKDGPFARSSRLRGEVEEAAKTPEFVPVQT
jgi:DNA topoisomerase-1